MAGLGRAGLHAAVAAKSLTVVHRGWYVEAAVWNSWYAESREVARSIAAVRAMGGGAVVLSHTSAAVMHGLPLYRFSPQRVHVTGPSTSGSVRLTDVARHTAITEKQVVIIEGIEVTSLARTVADVVGRLPLAAAVALWDAALRQVAWRRRMLRTDARTSRMTSTQPKCFARRRARVLHCNPERGGASKGDGCSPSLTAGPSCRANR